MVDSGHALMQRQRTRNGFVVLLCALLLTTAGCSYGITVRHAQGPDLLAAWKASITGDDELSPRTMQTLRRWDLDDDYRKHPAETFAQLQAAAAKDPAPDLLFALAEISYHLGRHAEKHENAGACRYYYLCSAYAYHYLFPSCPGEHVPHGPPGTEDHLRPVSCGAGTFDSFAFDPRFRLACDLYNTGLAKCIRAAQRVGQLDPRQQLQLPTPDGKGFTLSVVHHGFPWQPEEFGPLLFCADYEVVGLANNYRGYGLGVALMGTRSKDQSSQNGAKGGLRYPHEVSFPVSAFFRFDGTIADLGSQRAGRLELYNPLTIQTVRIGNRPVPLETDLTTPLAYFLSRTDLDGIEYTGFLQADKITDRTGIYAFEPYQPGKIPVIMVHGLLSSPLTWTTMFNDLRADPQIRAHYQFWFYLYPTGNPYLATAADFRQELCRLRGELDPRHLDPALDHMVLVGHSMGGLVSRLLTVESSGDFWQLVSKKPFDSLNLAADSREELQRTFFFEPQPNVERIIFIGTPHHGSNLSPSPPARLAAHFVRLPKRLMQVAGDVARADPQAFSGMHEGQLANSIDLLAPGSPALELMAARPRPPRVHFHSIIGEVFGKGENASDGVVPYRSAHLDEVDSEAIVPASHMVVHHHPRAVLEVWHILQAHLQEVQKAEHLIPIPAAAPKHQSQ